MYRTPTLIGKPVHGLVVLTRKGMLLYRPITRKQYIEYMIATFQRKYDDTIASAKQFEQNPAFMSLPESKEQLKQSTADLTKAWGDVIGRCQEALQKNATDNTLDAPAIVKIGSELACGVFTTEEENGQALVTVNPDYFRKDLPPYVQQFIVVHWIWEEHSAASTYYGKMVEANLPIEKFQAMIDR